MTAAQLGCLVLGGLVLLTTAVSITGTLVTPRGAQSRIVRALVWCVRTPYVGAARRRHGYERRDRMLAPIGPIILVAELVAWLALFLTGYALLLLALTPVGVEEAYREAGSSLFTIGYAQPPNSQAVLVDFAAGATGLVVIALLISYLPTLYRAYNRRETEVTLLQSRAGVPAWGPELLARHQLADLVDSLPALYRDWERWAADLAESHTTYPILVHFRSPKPMRSWVIAVLAVMDSAALYLARCPKAAPGEARLCVRMGFVCLRDLATAIHLPFDPDPLPDGKLGLTYEEFADAWDRPDAAGFPLEREAREAWPQFAGWRANYESIAYRLADLTDAPPALWSGSRHGVEKPIPPIRPIDRKPGAEPDVEAYGGQPPLDRPA